MNIDIYEILIKLKFFPHSKYNEIDVLFTFLKTLCCIREDLVKKRMFSFGHCPNQGGGRPLPESFGHQVLIPKISQYLLKVIILVCFLVIFVMNFIDIITITLIIIMSTIIIIICTDFCHTRNTSFLTSEKGGPSCPN